MLYLAAALIALLGIAHSVLGERYILTRLFKRDNLPQLLGGTAFTIQTLRFAWHITTVAWFGIACLLLLLAENKLTPNSTLLTIAWISLISGLLPLISTKGKHLSWIFFFAVSLILFWTAA